jgi:hypothetical protein
MNLPDQIQQSPGDSFHSGLGGDPSYHAQDHTELQLSYQSNQGPVAKSDRMADGWRHKIEWTRFEVDSLQRCRHDFEATKAIAVLLVQGKKDGSTRCAVQDVLRTLQKV